MHSDLEEHIGVGGSIEGVSNMFFLDSFYFRYVLPPYVHSQRADSRIAVLRIMMPHQLASRFGSQAVTESYEMLLQLTKAPDCPQQDPIVSSDGILAASMLE
jgi:hypothetical protein